MIRTVVLFSFFLFFSFNTTTTTEIYTLSLHDALPISASPRVRTAPAVSPKRRRCRLRDTRDGHCGHSAAESRSEEHTSELQSQSNLVCRLLLEKKKKKIHISKHINHTHTSTPATITNI